MATDHCFFKEFLVVAKVAIIPRKPEIKYNFLIIFLYFWLHNQNQTTESSNFYYFFGVTYGNQKRFFLKFLILHFGSIFPIKRNAATNQSLNYRVSPLDEVLGAQRWEGKV
jgi:hypothetical protein